jgi:hypothetical protein
MHPVAMLPISSAGGKISEEPKFSLYLFSENNGTSDGSELSIKSK